MEYSITELAKLAGISTRTLRYYDQIDLLKPSQKTPAGYRVYKSEDVDKLQVILFYKSLAIELKEVKKILADPNFSAVEALENQYQLLSRQKDHIDELLKTIRVTIRNYQGETLMNDEEKFASFKKERIAKNEALYGNEIRQKYGEKRVNESNAKFEKISSENFQRMQLIEIELIQDLVNFSKTDHNLDTDLAQKIFQEHRQWLSFSMTNYNKTIHRGLADMYIADQRFTDYYDQKAGVPVAQLLHDVIYRYTN